MTLTITQFHTTFNDNDLLVRYLPKIALVTTIEALVQPFLAFSGLIARNWPVSLYCVLGGVFQGSCRLF